MVRFLRGDQFSAIPLEQREAQLLLRMRQYFADGRLRHVEQFRRPGDRAAGIDSVENFDVTQTQ